MARKKSVNDIVAQWKRIANNRANSLIRRNVNRQQSYDSFMRNYIRITSARDNMLSNKTRSQGAVAG